MKRTLGILGILVVAFLLAAGCTQTGGGQTTAAPTAAPETPLPTIAEQATTMTSTGSGSLIPGPTETIPMNEAVTVTVEKAGTYSTTIIASFDGGKGQKIVSRCDVKVTRPDGSVVTGSLKPMIGDTVELEGTKGADRVEVTVYMQSGKTYKIIDELFPYKTRG